MNLYYTYYVQMYLHGMISVSNVAKNDKGTLTDCIVEMEENYG